MMGRSGFYEGDGQAEHNLFRGRVTRSLRGKRGQKALRDLIKGMDAMKEKKLAYGKFQSGGNMCAIGVIANARGLDFSDLNPDDPDDLVDHDIISSRLDIAECMSREIQYENDEAWYEVETDEHRWVRVRAWAVSLLKADPTPKEKE